MSMGKKTNSSVKVKNRYFILRDGQYINVKDLSQEEQNVIRKNFSEQLADSLMEGMGYTRVYSSNEKTTEK